MARGERTTAKRRARRLLLLAFGLGAGLVLAEVGVRVLRALGEQQRLETSQLASGAPASLQPGAEATLPQIVRAAKNPSIIYELRPDLDVTYKGVRVATNADGFRGPLRSRAKPANGYRIVGLGDSVLFGWGVPFEVCGLHVLEQQLQAALPQRVVEAIDTGVPGYNTAMEEQVLRDKGLAFAPDLVLVDFVGNDFDLPDFLWEHPDYWTLRKSFLLDLARHVVWQRQRQLEGPFVWSPYDAGASYESNLERVPPAYRHLVGEDAYRRAMTAIVALGAQHGFRVLVTGHHVMNPKAAAICKQLGVPVVNPAARIVQWLHEHGDPPYLGSPLTLSDQDPHPSAMLHAWWAEAIVAQLRELDWLPH